MKMKLQLSLMVGVAAVAAALLTGCAGMGMDDSPPASGLGESSLSAEARAALTQLTSDLPAAASLATRVTLACGTPAVKDLTIRQVVIK